VGTDFNIAHWVGPLISDGARRELRLKLRDYRRLMEHGQLVDLEIFPLGHMVVSNAFDPRFEEHIHPNDAHRDYVHAALTKRGAPKSCRILQLSVEFDDGSEFEYGEILPLRRVIELALGPGDGLSLVLLCLPGRLAYWQDGEYNDRAIVHRPS
jgi:hypothetical protein